MTREFTLRRVLLQPELLPDLPAPEVSRVVSQGRISRLLAALAAEVERTGLMPQLDERVRRHLHSALLVAEKQRHDLDYDCKSLQRALASAGQKLVLLKGGAYIQADLPVGRGRLITDIDIIVPKADIEAAEQALNSHGWESSQLDPYDEDYYRKWSHETPALVNRKRGTTLDLHHNILPPTSAPNVDASLLFERLREVRPGVYTLSLQDMVIHSATHLFHEGEFHHGLRDLWDLDRMLRDFPEREANFWGGLVPRARELELETPLFHGLTYTRLVFQTPVPASVMRQADSLPRRLRRPLLDFLYLRAFRPLQPDCRLPLTSLALNLLYVRSHFLRMPLHLLVPHLVRKAWMRRAAGRDNKPSAQKEVDAPRV
ncbi:MAG: nucleotidyltransferase family protein [Halioglobus sp.]|nr:nucleotidyltransferase family protein [Halioglobus sp.]